MTWSPITVRRHEVVCGWRRNTGWLWTCRPVRGRARGGFHHDHRFTDSRQPGRHPDAWTRCVRAALCHVHVEHRTLDPHPTDDTVTCHEETRNP